MQSPLYLEWNYQSLWMQDIKIRYLVNVYLQRHTKPDAVSINIHCIFFKTKLYRKDYDIDDTNLRMARA